MTSWKEIYTYQFSVPSCNMITPQGNIFIHVTDKTLLTHTEQPNTPHKYIHVTNKEILADTPLVLSYVQHAPKLVTHQGPLMESP